MFHIFTGQRPIYLHLNNRKWKTGKILSLQPFPPIFALSLI